MKRLFSKFVPRGGNTSVVPRGKAGARAFAVGDIHGRLDLLDDLLMKIAKDIERSPPRRSFIVLLGDLIDRGPDSAGVIERLRTLEPEDATIVVLAGNHEEILLRLLDGERGLLDSWLRFGGAECAASYGIEAAQLAILDEREAIEQVRRHIPASHAEFLRGLADSFRFGDYLFVHAGLRPGIPLEAQSVRDLRWIRDPFLNDSRPHDYVVVHGHTVVDEAEDKGNRIGIDTGAYRTGKLTALVIDGTEKRYLATARR